MKEFTLKTNMQIHLFKTSFKMKNTLLILAFCLVCMKSFANWIAVNPTIQDDLTCITFRNNIGLITGKQGVYYATDGGTISTSWLRAQSYFNTNDSTVYNQSQFSGCVSNSSSARMFFCGKDTITNQAVIFSFNTTNFQIHLEYLGDFNSALNKIAYYNSNGTYYAVGENGLLVTFNSSGNYQIYPTNFNYNLNSVSVRFTTLAIGAENCLIKANIGASLNFSIQAHPNRDFKDFECLQNTGDYAAIATNFARSTNNNYSEPHNYHPNSLDGNDLFYYSGQTFIGTNAGIYKTYGTTNVIEYQPTSGNYSILSITNNNTLLFAVGRNGIILYSTINGGTPHPYAEINANGGCVNTSIPISSLSGTVNSCNWSIDNVYNGNSCGATNYNATVTGNHTVRLIYSNGVYSDTAYRSFNVVTIPTTNLPLLLSDSILCHSESIDITIQNSGNNVYYSLLKVGSNANFNNSGIGNGSDLTFTSNPIDLSGDFYLKATSSLAACSANFTDIITIVVEQTKADFHVGLINAEHNEPTPLYQHCDEADYFQWDFSNQPNVATSALADPIVNFSQDGQSVIQLIAWSSNGCYDSIVKPGPFIYQEPQLTDSCYLMNINGVERAWSGTYNPDISNMTKLADGGFVITGKADTTYFSSKFGIGLQTNYRGMYVAKYTNSGVLKWIIKASHDQNTDQWEHTTDDLKENLGHDLFLSGTLGVSGFSAPYYLVDNKGDSILLSYSYLLKFNADGVLLWERQLVSFDAAQFKSISFDANQNPYVTLYHKLPFSGLIPALAIYSNQIPIDTVEQSVAPQNNFLARCYILKFNQNGDYIERFLVQTDAGYPKVLFDSDNNMILLGHTGVGGQFEIPSTGQIMDLPYHSSYIGAHMFVVKFNANGDYLWQIYGYTNNSLAGTYDYLGCFAADALLDDEGNIYITGQNAVNSDSPYFPMEIINSNNSITQFHGGAYFTTRINTNGICDWINGNISSTYGFGYDIIIDDSIIQTLVHIDDNPINLDLINTLTSSDSALIELSNYGSQVFIVSYDLNGNLVSILESGSDVDQVGSPFFQVNHFEKLTDDSYVWTSNYTNAITLNGSYVYFGDTLSPPPYTSPYENYPGLISKFVPSCGHLYEPYFVSYDQHFVCSGNYFQFADGIQLLVTDSSYHESHLTAINGYDSLVRTTVYGYTFGVINITELNDTLSTTTIADAYQWINCNQGNSLIPGADSLYFAPTETGDYALIVQYDDCIDTSSCVHFVSFVGIPETEISNAIIIYPNPTYSMISINSQVIMDDWTLRLFSEEGRQLQIVYLNSMNYTFSIDYPAGTYFIEISTPESPNRIFKLNKL